MCTFTECVDQLMWSWDWDSLPENASFIDNKRICLWKDHDGSHAYAWHLAQRTQSLFGCTCQECDLSTQETMDTRQPSEAWCHILGAIPVVRRANMQMAWGRCVLGWGMAGICMKQAIHEVLILR